MWSFAAAFLARCRAQSMLLRTIRELLVDERDDMAPRRERQREVLCCGRRRMKNMLKNRGANVVRIPSGYA